MKIKLNMKPNNVLIYAGLALFACAATLLIYTTVDDYLAGQRARQLLAEIQVVSPPEATQPDSNAIIDYVAAPIGQEEEPAEPEPQIAENGQEMPEEATPPSPLPSYNIIGVISVPSLKLKLPVIDECSNSLLKVSICLYQGSVEPEPQRLVVAGHNYKSHFGRIPKLNLGDEVRLTTVAGEEYQYMVSGIEEIAGNDHAGLEQGEWDITLFTCTPGGSRRILVRCDKI